MHVGCVTITESREKLQVQKIKTGISEESSPESFKTMSSNCTSLEQSKAVKYVTSPALETAGTLLQQNRVYEKQTSPWIHGSTVPTPPFSSGGTCQGCSCLPSPAFEPCKRQQLCPLSWAEICSSKCAVSVFWQQPWRWLLCKVHSQPAEDNWISHSFPRDDLH